MILNQPDFFARSATLDGAISDTDTQITLTGLSTRFTDAVAAGTVRYPIGPFRISDDDGFELIAITGHVSGSTFEVERGFQGATAEAWADGTALRAVVTREYLTPSSLALSGAPAQAYCADNFQRSDRNIAGDFAPTGQEYSVFNLDGGTEREMQIRDGLLLRDENFGMEAAIMVPAPATASIWIRAGIIDYGSGGRDIGIIPFFVDIDNFIYTNVRSQVIVVENGVETILGEEFSRVARAPLAFNIFFGINSNELVRRIGAVNAERSLGSYMDIVNNSTHCGLYNGHSVSSGGFFSFMVMARP